MTTVNVNTTENVTIKNDCIVNKSKLTIDCVNTNNVTNSDHCYLCDTTYRLGGNVIGCDSCGTWLHQSCIGLSDCEYELLQRAEKFYCEPCESLMPGVPNLPEPTVLPNAASENLEWGSVIKSKFCQSVNSAYESIVIII